MVGGGGCSLGLCGSLGLSFDGFHVCRLHGREEDDFLDVNIIGEKHCESIDSKTPTASRRKTVLKRRAEHFIDQLRLIVTSILVLGLLRETSALDVRIVQLGVRIANLSGIHKHLEALGQARDVSVILRQRGHDLRMIDDERRIDAGDLDELSDQLVQQTRRGLRWRAMHVVLSAQIRQEQTSLLRVERLRDGDLERILQTLNQIDATPRSLEIDFNRFLILSICVVLDLRSTGDLLHHPRDQILGHVHQIVVVRVGHVELDRGELWIVGQIDSLISELLSDFVNAIDSADNQLLQVQFRRDAHEQIHAQVVVMRHEWLRRSSACNHVHHRSFHFEEIACIQVLANAVDHLRTNEEIPSNGVRVRNQIQEAIAIASLLVGERLLGKHVQARRKKNKSMRENRQFAGLRTTWNSLDADDVTTTKNRIHTIEFFGVGIVALVCENLQRSAASRERVEEQAGASSALQLHTT
jgi:hypothetical protein